MVGATESWKTTTDPATDYGMAYIFERVSHGNFNQVVKLTPDPAFAPPRAAFGGSVAIDGDRGETSAIRGFLFVFISLTRAYSFPHVQL